jgi:hypothetical protein
MLMVSWGGCNGGRICYYSVWGCLPQLIVFHQHNHYYFPIRTVNLSMFCQKSKIKKEQLHTVYDHNFKISFKYCTVKNLIL